MLDHEPYGLGCTKKLATLYKMDAFDIKNLLKQSNPGELLLDYIYAKFPNKTVHEFCKDLQRPGIERNDIVDKLCDFLKNRKDDEQLSSPTETEKSHV